MNTKTRIRYQGRIVTKQWMKKYAGRTTEDREIQVELNRLPPRVPTDSAETFDRRVTIMWFAHLDDEALADAWRYAVNRRTKLR